MSRAQSTHSVRDWDAFSSRCAKGEAKRQQIIARHRERARLVRKQAKQKRR